MSNLASSSTSPSSSSLSWSLHRKYAVLLDAGSSGTRLQVYSWLDPKYEIDNLVSSSSTTPTTTNPELIYEGTSGNHRLGTNHDPGKAKQDKGLLKQLPKVEKGTWDESGKQWSIKVEPGLSSFSNHPQDLPTYLTPLFNHATSLIPKDQLSQTPIYLLATAGMRLLPKSSRKEILRSTCSFIKNQTSFKVVEKVISDKASVSTSKGDPSEVEEDESGCGESVRVISGEEEGLLGWISINYLMDGFQFQSSVKDGISSSTSNEKGKGKGKGKHDHTFGFLDMGGASTQIAFEPSKKSLKQSGLEISSDLNKGKGFEIDEKEKIKPSLSTSSSNKNENQTKTIGGGGSETSEELTSISLNLLDGSTTEHKVFVTTFLGFGTNVARERYSFSILEDFLRNNSSLLSSSTSTSSSPLPSSASLSTSIPDPCLPTDLILNFTPTSQQRQELTTSISTNKYGTLPDSFDFKGTGNFTKCLELTEPLLDKHAACNHPPCLFHGVHTPEIDFEVDRFVGVSEYWFSANDVFKLGGVYSFPSFQASASKFCSENWSKLSFDLKSGSYGPQVDLSRLQMQCFKAAWMTTVLHEGIGLPRLLDSSNDKTSINQNSSEHSHSNDYTHAEDAVDKADDKNLATFQSVNDLRGLAVSWTLGKAVLEASREVGEALKINLEVEKGTKGKELEVFHQEQDDDKPWNKIPDGENGSHSFPHLPSSSIDRNISSSQNRFILIGILIGILVLFFTKRRKSRRRGATSFNNDRNSRSPSIVFNFGKFLSSGWKGGSSSRSGGIMNGRGDYVLANMEEGADGGTYDSNSDNDDHNDYSREISKVKPTSFERIFRRVTFNLGLRTVRRNPNRGKRRSGLLPTNVENHNQMYQSNSNLVGTSSNPGYSKMFAPRTPSRPGSGAVSPVLGRRSTPPINVHQNPHIFNSSLTSGRNSPVSFNHSGANTGNVNTSASTSALSSRANSPSFGLSVNQKDLGGGIRRSSATSPAPPPSQQNEFRRIASGNAISSMGMSSFSSSRNGPSRSGTSTPLQISVGSSRNGWGELD